MATTEGLRREAAAKLALCIERINTRSTSAIPIDQVTPCIDAIVRLTVAEIVDHIDPRNHEPFIDLERPDPTTDQPETPPDP